MTALVEIAAVCVALTAIAVFARTAYRKVRDFVHFHDKLEKHLSPNGNKPLTEGGTFFDALHRIETKQDVLQMDHSDLRDSLTIHVATSDMERANLRLAVANLESALRRVLPQGE